MRIKSFLIIVLGTLACMLLLDDLVPQPLVSHDSNLVYAMGGHHHRQYLGQPGDQGYEGDQGDQGYQVDQENPNSNSAAPSVIPEPSTLLLLVSGLFGLAGYGRKRFFKK